MRIEGVAPLLTVYAKNAKECDILVKVWLKRQKLSVDTKYKKGDSYCIKKDTPSDIVEQEFEFLKEWIC